MQDPSYSRFSRVRQPFLPCVHRLEATPGNPATGTIGNFPGNFRPLPGATESARRNGPTGQGKEKIMLKTKSGLVAILLASALAACGGSPTRESTGEYIDDAAITTKVKTAFVEDKEVKAANVKVETFKGTVQLSGFAESGNEINRAMEIASKVPGVKSVRNDIRLKASGQ